MDVVRSHIEGVKKPLSVPANLANRAIDDGATPRLKNNREVAKLALPVRQEVPIWHE